MIAPAILASALLTPPAGAVTSAGAGILEGGGTLAPGLTMTPTFQTYSFAGTMIGGYAVGTAGAGAMMTCSFSGASTIAETSIHGQGNFSGSCSGGLVQLGTTASAVMTWLYIRVGSEYVVIYQGSTMTTGGPTGSGNQTAFEGTGQFKWIPTSGNGVTSPISAWVIAGTFQLVGGP